ncbi:hypothetical protein CkaCkLH20_03131 [Colletotrichum karsti]|uniref:3-beta hydroxysteroid dehydrogenase/isomerase domain-containing protein n=1 Tax=Colletotrichum karsti TaxID=1095194 RepID=A0A9P6IAZ9_9PEZI|nr:uncharacterized protein CkaCkLH20_03131 [Colletotrichum karsti]KAF9879588.1 hypothetical protein CkaCkLH20_03131 [Colletotrichum karsti]
MEAVTVPDITAPDAYGNALQNVDFVVHCASPFTFNVTDIQRDLLDPAIKGTAEIMKAIDRAPSVKRIVLTSSFAAVIDPFKNPRPGYTYTEADWNPVTPTQALENQLFGYQASKTFAERLALDFTEIQNAKGRDLSLIAICPPMILGPVHPASGITSANPNESSAQLLNALSAPEVPPTRMPVFVDVRDAAKAHVLALNLDKVRADVSERFLVCGGKFTWAVVGDIHRGVRMTEEVFAPSNGYYSIDAGKAEKVLGLVWTSLESAVEDCIASLKPYA